MFTPEIERLVSDLHAKSDAQLADIETYVKQARVTRSPTKEADFKVYRSDKLLALDRDKAMFCYQMCRTINAHRVVEIGTSYGVSTVYLATAVRDNVRLSGKAGVVVGTEYEPNKAIAARGLFREVGLDSLIQVLDGDFNETLRHVDIPIDFMLIDAWIGAAKPALEIVGPKMRVGSVVICDDVHSGRCADYYALLSDSGFRTTVLPFQNGMAWSVRCG